MTFEKDLKILIPKMRGKQDSLFYHDQDIAIAKAPNGIRFKLIAVGDIGINFESWFYDNSNVDEFIKEQKLTDRKLEKLRDSGKLMWENNNWFEVIWQKGENGAWDCDLGTVEYDYDWAINMLKDYYDGKYV